ncbi:DUF6236 family protein [Streptomyces sp. MI02-7b]|uniref:DUF6236 family protein n=1 Tax=Streptomyces sp. MI02-7b TaxID=462941 RepID=UPI0029A2EC43|nr:DUF6236 family protein [Streptomyces sp. MI02-7b]MDX3077857.1 DUF6236 family protein [Streptomyces sp. MI02-7b]
MRQIGLYYPYVHFRDERWVKAAALYWRRLARVVPDGFPVRDRASVKALRDQLDFLVDVDPRPAAEKVAPAFAEAIRGNEQMLRRRFQVADRVFDHREAPAEPGRLEDLHGLPQRRRHLAGLYVAEVPWELREALEGAGLAQRGFRHRAGDDHEGWVAVDPAVAWVYKCALTEELARQTAYIPITDQAEAHTATSGWTSDRIAAVLLGDQPRPVPEQAATRLGLMAVQYVLPANLQAVPIDKIIELRTKHADEFTAFATAVETTASNLIEHTAGITDRQAFEVHLQTAFEDTIVQPLNELRGAMTGLNMQTIVSALNVQTQVPAIATALGGWWAGGAPVAVAGIAIGAVTVRHAATRARDGQLETSPVGYLLRAERTLKPATLVRRVGRAAARVAGTGI